MAKMSSTQYFFFFLIISVITMRSAVVGEGGICEKVELTEQCGFIDCPQICRDLYKESFAAGECITGPSKHPQCVCFYYCSSTTSNTPVSRISN